MKTKFIIALSLLISTTLFAETKPTILFVGDSHSFGSFGKVIDKNLSTISDNVIMESSCGSSPVNWLAQGGYKKTVCGFWKKDANEEIRSEKAHRTPKFSEELATYHPEVTIVQLGTNIASDNDPLNYSRSIELMMTQMKSENSKCIWIGPPDANSKEVTKNKLKIVNDLLIKLTKKHHCYYIDSLLITEFPLTSKEGIHYPPKLSAEWGEKVSTQILEIIKSLSTKAN